MATVSDLFSRLKSIVVGVKSTQIDVKLDKAVQELEAIIKAEKCKKNR